MSQLLQATGKAYTGFPLRVSRLAQLVERKTLNLVVVGSSPTVGVLFAVVFFLLALHKNIFSLHVPSFAGVHSTRGPFLSSCGAAGSAWVS